jgi:hypothetical protein
MNMLLPIYLIVVALICFAAIPFARRDGEAQIVTETSRSLVSATGGRRPGFRHEERRKERGDAVMGALPLP